MNVCSYVHLTNGGRSQNWLSNLLKSDDFSQIVGLSCLTYARWKLRILYIFWLPSNGHSEFGNPDTIVLLHDLTVNIYEEVYSSALGSNHPSQCSKNILFSSYDCHVHAIFLVWNFFQQLELLYLLSLANVHTDTNEHDGSLLETLLH